jgi:hypothetical protein
MLFSVRFSGYITPAWGTTRDLYENTSCGREAFQKRNTVKYSAGHPL